MLEKTWKAEICSELRKCNALVYQLLAGVPKGYSGREGVKYASEPGWPDVYVSHTYWQGFIEFKGEKTKLTEKQKHIIGGLNKRCGEKYGAVICRYGEEVCFIENEKGIFLGSFTSALDLLRILRELKQKGE